MLDRFEKALKKRLTDYEEDPAPALWPAIKPTPRHSTSFGWMDATEIFSIVMLLGMLGWVNVSNKDPHVESQLLTNTRKNLLTLPIDSLTEGTTSNPKAEEKNNQPVTNVDKGNQRVIPTNQIAINQHNRADSIPSSTRIRSDVKNRQRVTTSSVSLPTLAASTTGKIPSINNTSPPTEANNSKNNAVQTKETAGNYFLFGHHLLFAKAEINKPVWKTVAFKMTNELGPSTKKDALQQKQHSSFLKGAIYIQATPVISYQRVISNTRDSQYINDLQSLPALSPKRIGFRIESGWEWDFTDRIKISVGAVYFQRKQELRYTTQSIERMETMETASGTLVLTPVLATENHVLEFDTKSMGAGAQMTYQLTKNRWINYIGGGIDYQYALTQVAQSDQLTEPTQYVFVNLFYRITYPATQRVTLFVQPTINYTTNFTNTFTSALYAKPYGIGLGLGAIIKLKARAKDE